MGHTSYCTTAKTARSGVQEIIRAQLNEIGQEINTHQQELRKRVRKEIGLETIYKSMEVLRNKASKLEKEHDVRVKAEMAEFDKKFKKKRDRLCELRSKVLFAKTAQVREIYEELSKAEVR